MGEQRHDYVALDWVKKELEETLKSAQQALELFVEEPEDRSSITHCQAYLSQVRGTLQMLQFYGAALLAEEIELLARALGESSVADERNAQELLMQSMLQLPKYLEYIKRGHRDLPVVLLPVLNDLRSARGERLLTETTVFNPDITPRFPPLPPEVIQKLSSSEFMDLIRKLRQMYQVALTGFIRQENERQNLDYLFKIFVRLIKLCGRTPLGQLWVLGAALCEALFQGGIRNSASIKTLLRKIDKELKGLVDKGPPHLNVTPNQDLMRNLLYFIAKCEKETDRVKQVRDLFDLHGSLPTADELKEERTVLSSPDSDTIASVVTALQEEIGGVKEKLDFIVNLSEVGDQDLEGMPGKFKQIADTLLMLGLVDPQMLMQKEHDHIQKLMDARQSFKPSLLASSVSALLKVESAVANLPSGGSGESSGQLNAAQQVVVREARHLLEAVKETINDFLATQHETESFSHLGDWLSKLSGSLRMIPLNDAAHLVDGIHQVVRDHLLEASAPNEAVLEPLAESMSGLEYYLERISNDGIHSNRNLLTRAESAIESLISPVAKAEQEAASEQAAAPQSAPKPPAPEPQPVAAEPPKAPEPPPAPEPTPEPEASEDEDDLIDDEIVEIFLEEAEEVLETIGEFWPQLQTDRSNDDALTTIRRAFHTLKGSGRMVGAEDIGELAWSIENMLNRVIEKTIPLSDNVMDIITHVIGLLPDAVEAFKNRKPLPFAAEPLQSYAFSLAGGREVPPLQDALASSAGAAAPAEPESAPVEPEPVSEPEPVAEESPTAAAPDDDDDSDPALMEIFSSEVQGHLETVESFLTDAVGNDYQEPLTDAVQRAFHTIKGSANLAKIPPMARIAGRLEKLVKELRAYQVGNSRELNEAIQEGYDLMEQAFKHVTVDESNPMPTDERVDTYVDGVNALKRRLTEAAAANVVEALGKQPAFADPQVISLFLAEGMDILMDAERILERWEQSPSSFDQVESLINELKTLERGAQMAELPPIEQLANTLETLYSRILAQGYSPDAPFFALAHRGHEALLDMMDQVAAAQTIKPDASLLNELNAWLSTHQVDAPAAEPTSTAPSDFASSAPSADEDLEEASKSFDALLQTTFDDLAGTTSETTESEPEEVVAPEVPESPAPVSPLDAISIEPETPVAPPEPPPVPVEPVPASAPAPMQGVEPEPIVADEEMLEIFLDEALELIDTASEALNRWQKDPDNLIEVAKLQRDLHTFKGGARMAEISSIGDLTHELEFLYEAVNDGRRHPSGDLFNLLHLCHDRLADMVSAVQEGNPLYPALDLVPVLQTFIKEGKLVQPEAPKAVSAPVVEAPAKPVAPQETPVSASTTAPKAPVAETPAPAVTKAPMPARGPMPQMNEDDQEVVEIFLDEAGELIEATDKAIHAWEQDPMNMEHSEELQRHLHTLKGGARLAGLTDVGNTAHDFESMLVKWALQQGSADAKFFADLHSRFDTISDQVEGLQKWVAGELPAPEEAQANLPATQQAAPSNVVEMRSREDAQSRKPKEMVKVSAELLEGLVNLAGETSIARGRLEQQVSDFGNILEEMDTTIERLREQLRRLDIETEAQILFRQEISGPDYEDFDPLEMDRYSTLQQLSRALVESSYDLLDLKDTLVNRARDAESLLLQQSRVNTELQEGLMKTRMVPFSRLVPRLRRIVRQTAGELGKKVEFEAVNAEGELDRTLLERMVGPLEHMLRNAVDHGVEMPNVRQAANKNETGQVTLTLSREGGDVVLRLKDDGGGINVDVIRNKAIERGLMEEGAPLSDHDILQFIMQAGFSTAEQVTQISGRGVGMDVVRSEIKQMGGNVSIDSKVGQGTEFTVSLPFTVSVNRALMVNVGDDMYAIPLTTIEGIVRVSPYELEELYRSDSPQFDYAGETYRLDYLGNLLRNGTSPKLQGQPLPLPVVLVRGAEPAALQVDALLGSREIVVKALGPQFNTVVGVSGGTILGDGSVVVILDLGNMVRHLRSLEYLKHLEQEQQAEKALEARKASKPASILVVDDSVTVRKVTTRLLERQGMEVRTAKDGVDAMNALQDQVPDLVLLDIEMPRMDGFEVASLMRHDPVLKDVPIIMITSRTGEKHKERAMSIGVTEYMGKPFQEDILLTSIRKLTGRD